MNATIYERGNGFADVGDYVSGDGNLYRVTATSGNIQTGNPGSGAPNYMAAEVEEADWDDLTDEQADAIICTCTVAGIPTEPAPGEGQ